MLSGKSQEGGAPPRPCISPFCVQRGAPRICTHRLSFPFLGVRRSKARRPASRTTLAFGSWGHRASQAEPRVGGGHYGGARPPTSGWGTPSSTAYLILTHRTFRGSSPSVCSHPRDTDSPSFPAQLRRHAPCGSSRLPPLPVRRTAEATPAPVTSPVGSGWTCV